LKTATDVYYHQKPTSHTECRLLSIYARVVTLAQVIVEQFIHMLRWWRLINQQKYEHPHNLQYGEYYVCFGSPVHA